MIIEIYLLLKIFILYISCIGTSFREDSIKRRALQDIKGILDIFYGVVN